MEKWGQLRGQLGVTALDFRDERGERGEEQDASTVESQNPDGSGLAVPVEGFRFSQLTRTSTRFELNELLYSPNSNRKATSGAEKDGGERGREIAAERDMEDKTERAILAFRLDAIAMAGVRLDAQPPYH